MSSLPSAHIEPSGSAFPQSLISEERIDFVEYWRSIQKRKWQIIGLAIGVTLITAMVVFSMRPVYQSTAVVLIEFGKSKVVSIEEVYTGASANREYLQTQVEILKSRELAKKVVAKLILSKHPDFDPTLSQQGIFGLKWRNWLPSSWLSEPPALTEEKILDRVEKAFMSNLEVLPIRNTQLVKISFESYDKELAAKVPNALADAYIEGDLEAKVQMTQKASGWLTERLTGLRKKLEESEKTLQQFRERERIVDVKGAAMSGVGRQLDEFTTGLVAARQRRAEAENSYNQVQQAVRNHQSLDSLPVILKHQQYVSFKDKEAEASRKYAELSQRYGKEHPKLLAAEMDLKSAQENLKRQVDFVVASITKEYEVARANEQALERALGQAKSDVQGLNRKEYELGVLDREVAANRQLYDMFLNRFKQTDVSSDMQGTIARVVDPSIVASSPAKPQKTRIVAIALVIGLFLGVLMALLLDRLDNTFKTSADVEARVGLPVLGVGPLIKDTKKIPPQRIFIDDNQSVFAESIRTIRTAVMLSALDEPKKILMVTSSIPQEGKTTISINLALALSHVKRVLLIDADMRRPSLGKSLGFAPDAPGLSHFVAGSAPISKCIYPFEGSNLHVMPSGIIPPNPLELLMSNRFKEVLKTLSETFDYIVIDSAPVHLVSDALILSHLVNEIVFVTKADSTPFQVARTGIRRLQAAGGNVLGVVLNQLDMVKSEKYYGDYGGYGYKGYKNYGGQAYGYGQEKSKKAT
jgi:exopolysaccharide transport family protein